MQGGFDVPWSGYYVQNFVEEPMDFENMWISSTGQIMGRGSDAVGNFDINGMISPNGCFQFMKQYQGAHGVAYNGTVSPGCLSGVWSVNGMKGEFALNLDTQHWKGSFTLDGRTYPMQTNIYVSEAGVFGLGKDAEGVFVISGTYNPASSKLNFIKTYLGRYEIVYDGTMFDDGQYLVVNGSWGLSTGQQGTYEMYQRIEGRTVQYQQFFHPPAPPQNYVPTFFGMPPQQIPPQYSQMQGQGAGGALFGLLDDLDIHGGDADDVKKIMDKLSRGKKISGKQLATFIPMVRNQDDLAGFLQSLNENKVQNLTMDDLVEGLSGAKNQEYNPKAIVFLYPLIKPTPGALENTKLDKLFVFNKDKREVEKALGIDL